MSVDAKITLKSKVDEIVVHSPHRDGIEGFDLDQSPDGMYSTGFTLRTIARSTGGIVGGTELPVRDLVLPFHIQSTASASIEEQISRFRRLWGAPRNLHKVQWLYEGADDARWLWLRLSREIEFKEAIDWNVNEYAHAVVSAVAVDPMYESKPTTLLLDHPGGGGWQTVWVYASNPTDQPCWPEWSLIPNGTCKFRVPDLSWGQEQDIDLSWTVNEFDDRMIEIAPGGNGIGVNWSIMSDPLQDTYVAANLSNAAGQMGGVMPLFPIPPHTKKTLIPVQFNGSTSAKVEMNLRRFWSAESGMR